MNLFTRCWKGEASLATAFWLIYFLFGLIIELVVAFILASLIANFTWVNYINLIMTIVFPYTLFSAICVWRCARNSNAFWRILARIVIVISVIFGIIHILQLLLHRSIVPQPQLPTPTTTSV